MIFLTKLYADSWKNTKSTRSMCFSRKICILGLNFVALNEIMHRLNEGGISSLVSLSSGSLTTESLVLLLSLLYPLYFLFASLQRFSSSSSRMSSLMLVMSLSSSFRISSISLLKFSSAALDLKYFCATSLSIKPLKRLKELSNASALYMGLFGLKLTLAGGWL